MTLKLSFAVLSIVAMTAGAMLAQQPAPPSGQKLPLAERIAHTTPEKYRASPAVHGGPGQLDYMGLFNATAMDTNLYFLHRGVIQPKSGIGAHFHNQCEEMFVILDGEAQFTINGHTSLLKGPAGAPVRMGGSHAIYNHTDKPVQWMNINVSARKGVYDAFDLGDGRVGAALEPVPSFMTMRLDQTLLRPAAAMAAKGTVQYRRALPPSVFIGPWAYVDHLVVAPGSVTAPQTHAEIGEFYYVMNGQGTAKVGADSAPIRAGDAVPIQLNETTSFENTGSAQLELLVVGVVRDVNKKFDVVVPPARDGRGN
ncbi:MAG TPA: cupin domain-containing protein [Vicinamibacterales bacterium]|nr:cupin domain-containing protein [Vicinamibacterales bacterium]